MKTKSKVAAAVLVALAAVSATAMAAATKVKAPLVCTRGDSDQTMNALITMPATAAVGSKFTVRVDGVNSGKISHTGLNYIFDMTTDYLVPDGAKVVDGSVKVVAETGTANVRAGAKAWNDKSGIHTYLPAHVEDGSDFTPPSLEFQLEVTGAVGTSMAFKLAQYRVAANAFVVGDVHTICDPNPKPYTLGTTVAAKAE
ncbi:MAG: hypothetical protein ACHREM_10795 [Polyangiales bacterium]